MEKDTVLKVVQSVKNPIAERLDSLFEKELEEMYSNIEYSFSILGKVLDAETSPDDDFYSATMLWTFQNTLISSVSLLRQGYLIEPMMLLRNAVEGFSVAYSLQKDEALLKKFAANPRKFPSNMQITFMSKEFPLIGKLYGILSNFTHASEFHAVPSAAIQPFKIGPGISSEENKYFRLEIIILKQVIYVLSSIIEFSYYKYSKSERFWTMDSKGGSMLFKGLDLTELDLAIKDLDVQE